MVKPLRTALVVTASVLLWAMPAHAVDVPQSAFASGAPYHGHDHAETRLLVDHETVASGESFQVGVLFDLDDGWHVYGNKPGSVGLPTKIVWSLDHGSVGQLKWPRTQTFGEGTLESYGYAKRVLFAAPAKLDAGAAGKVTLTAEVSYLACAETCIPGKAVLTRTIEVGTSQTADDEIQQIFATSGRVPDEEQQPPDDATAHKVDPPAAPALKAPHPKKLPLWETLLFAFLGGLLLNLMPCVFPVLALKVFGFVSAGAEGHKTAMKHAAAYAGGILASMGVLAGAVLAFRFTGEAVGWGFQFQQPGYLAALAVFVALFALNLFGVFELPLLPVPSRSIGSPTAGRSFVDGILAVVLATPCSAPFLGTAVGFALAASAGYIIATFMAIGLGLASPYVVASVFPVLARFLPKPGPWMATVERILGFVLLGTTVWLIWIFGKVAGVDGIGHLLSAMLVASVGAWIWGKLQYAETRKRILGAVVGIGLAVGGFAFFAPWRDFAPQTTSTAPDSQWAKFDKAQVRAAQKAGKAVFVDFTADWCLTCKANEKAVLADAQVEKALTAPGIVTMRGDWTRRDEKIRKVLASFGRAGVPLYLVYPAGGGAPQVLPEVLTSDIVLDALKKARARR